MKKIAITRVMLVLFLQFFAVQACIAGKTAAYTEHLRLLSVLNMAIGYLDDFTPSRDINERLISAITSIDNAAQEIMSSAPDIEKNIEFRPDIDSAMKKPERYQKALELLEMCRDDINMTKGEMYPEGVKSRIAAHIDKAVEGILSRSNYSGSHPGYMSALSGLNAARSYLNKITPNLKLDNTKLNAIGEINKAMNSIRAAAVIGGLDITDYSLQVPDVTEGERFSTTLEVLNRALKDVSVEEDNLFAKNSQKLALRRINNAISIVSKIVR